MDNFAKPIYRFKLGDRVRVKSLFGGGKQINGERMNGTVTKATYRKGGIAPGGNIGYLSILWDNGHTGRHTQERTVELTAMGFACPSCLASADERCHTHNDHQKVSHPHAARVKSALEVKGSTPTMRWSKAKRIRNGVYLYRGYRIARDEVAGDWDITITGKDDNDPFIGGGDTLASCLLTVNQIIARLDARRRQ